MIEQQELDQKLLSTHIQNLHLEPHWQAAQALTGT
jgi:hypothetical protein